MHGEAAAAAPSSSAYVREYLSWDGHEADAHAELAMLPNIDCRAWAMDIAATYPSSCGALHSWP